jgi:predicted GNAT superfamily acetyltransferase
MMPDPTRTDAPTDREPDVELRSLEGPEEYALCGELQRDTWGHDFGEIVPPALLQVTQKVGGIAAGAFDRHRRLVGFVYGLSGLREGSPVHWSHMLAVRKDWEGKGLGTRLKGYQRDRLIDLGIEIALWTFDPLVARNAHFNLNRLAVTIEEYVPNMYSETRSDLHSGLGTDRFLARWDLRSDRVFHTLSEGLGPQVQLPPDSPVVGLDGEGSPIVGGGEYPEDPVVRIPIPDDIQAVKAESSELGRCWRKMTRDAFVWYLTHCYQVSGFRRDPSGRTPQYVLTSRNHGTSR